jgi:hypothetical protein
MRKVFAEVKVKLVINADNDIEPSEIINEMDYSFSDQTGKANIEDSEILDYTLLEGYNANN